MRLDAVRTAGMQQRARHAVTESRYVTVHVCSFPKSAALKMDPQ